MAGASPRRTLLEPSHDRPEARAAAPAGRPAPCDPFGILADPADPRAAVDSALAGLDGLAERPLAEHVEAFERVHTALSDALAAGTSGGS